jgi:S1-C subfamily serine protease
MNALDVILLLLVLAYGVSGYWQGFITGAFATGGLLLGFGLGLWLSPRVFSSASQPSMWVTLAFLGLLLLCASFGQGMLQLLGARIRDRLRWQPVRALDAVGGAALSMAAVLLVAWALGVLVSGASVPMLTRAVNGSAVLQRVNELMPKRAIGALSDLNEAVGSSDFPRYLEPFAREQIVQVGPPPGRVAKDPDIRAASRSVVKVLGTGCGRGVEGSGFLYSPNRVMTNAHVVEGVAEPRVVVGNQEVPARVVLYDPDVDVAVLAVEGLDLPSLSFDREGRPEEPGAVLGYPQDGPLDVRPARIRAVQRLRSPDIYNSGTVVREVFSVRALVRPGNSGGPLVSRDGEVLGVVFAASNTDSDTGYALTAEQVAEAAAEGLATGTLVGTGSCP